MDTYFTSAKEAIDGLDFETIEKIATRLAGLRDAFLGRLFLIGVGGNAADCAHAAADFRKLCGLEAYALDNISEITARTNDDGWDTVFSGYLESSNLDGSDVVFVLSVGGGTDTASKGIAEAVEYARDSQATVIGIVGPVGGATYKRGDLVVRIPVKDKELTTPLTHSLQALILHYLFNHPRLRLE